MFCNEVTGSRDNGQIDPSRVPLASFGLGPEGQHKPRLGWPVLTFPSVPALSPTPGDQTGSGAQPTNPTGRAAWFPDIVRRIIPSLIERRGPQHGPLTGSLSDVNHDPEGRGIHIEPVQQEAVGMRNAGDIMTNGRDVDILPVADSGANFDNVAPDLSESVQTPHSNEHVSLRSARASYPGINISPVPQTRTVIIAATNTNTEIPIPSGAVFFRISWSGRYSGVDLLCSMNGGVNATFNVADNNALGSHDGLFVNPNPDANIYCKGKLAITVMVPASTAVPAVFPVFVSIECYCNNS